MTTYEDIEALKGVKTLETVQPSQSGSSLMAHVIVDETFNHDDAKAQLPSIVAIHQPAWCKDRATVEYK